MVQRRSLFALAAGLAAPAAATLPRPALAQRRTGPPAPSG